MTHDDRVDDPVFFEGKLILMQRTNPLIRCDGHVAGGGRKTAVQNLHEGGFTTAIGTDQAIAITFTKFNGDVFKQRLGTKLHSDVSGRDQGNILGAIKRKRWSNEGCGLYAVVGNASRGSQKYL